MRACRLSAERPNSDETVCVGDWADGVPVNCLAYAMEVAYGAAGCAPATKRTQSGSVADTCYQHSASSYRQVLCTAEAFLTYSCDDAACTACTFLISAGVHTCATIDGPVWTTRYCVATPAPTGAPSATPTPTGTGAPTQRRLGPAHSHPRRRSQRVRCA